MINAGDNQTREGCNCRGYYCEVSRSGANGYIGVVKKNICKVFCGIPYLAHEIKSSHCNRLLQQRVLLAFNVSIT